jgi:hypothetical protein
MCRAIRPQADLLRQNARLLNDTRPRTDVLLFLPFRRWVETADCRVWTTALALSRANAQFDVASEDDLVKRLRKVPGAVLLLESRAVLQEPELKAVSEFEARGGRVMTTGKATWLEELRGQLPGPSLKLEAPTSVRGVVRDQGRRTMVHLLNLNVQRLSSFEDKVTPATDIGVEVRVPLKQVRQVRRLTADEPQPTGSVHFTSRAEKGCTVVGFKLKELAVSAIAVIE